MAIKVKAMVQLFLYSYLLQAKRHCGTAFLCALFIVLPSPVQSKIWLCCKIFSLYDKKYIPFFHNRGRQNTNGYGKGQVLRNNDKSGECPACWGLWRNAAIPNPGTRYRSPVHGNTNAGKSVFRVFNNTFNAASYDDANDNTE